jgi:ribose 5-phosphate isomerase A
MDDTRKARAAEEAVREVVSGQILGLGSGSTAAIAVTRIGERFQHGELRDIVGVPTSEATRAIAERYGIPVAPIDAYAAIDLAIDGADEVGPGLDLIKGLGGALLREKAVERKAKRFVVIVDDSKLVARLGTKAPVPLEVAPASWRDLLEPLRTLGGDPILREGPSGARTTDQGNYLIDCWFRAGIADAHALAARFEAIPLVLEHGLFLGMADVVIVADAHGIRRIDRHAAI